MESHGYREFEYEGVGIFIPYNSIPSPVSFNTYPKFENRKDGMF